VVEGVDRGEFIDECGFFELEWQRVEEFYYDVDDEWQCYEHVV